MRLRRTAAAVIAALAGAGTLTGCSDAEAEDRHDRAVSVLGEATKVAEEFVGGVEIRGEFLDVSEDVNNHVELPDGFEFTRYDYDPANGERSVCLTTPDGWYGYAGKEGVRGPVKHGQGNGCDDEGRKVADPVQ